MRLLPVVNYVAAAAAVLVLESGYVLKPAEGEALPIRQLLGADVLKNFRDALWYEKTDQVDLRSVDGLEVGKPFFTVVKPGNSCIVESKVVITIDSAMIRNYPLDCPNGVEVGKFSEEFDSEEETTVSLDRLLELQNDGGMLFGLEESGGAVKIFNQYVVKEWVSRYGVIKPGAGRWDTKQSLVARQIVPAKEMINFAAGEDRKNFVARFRDESGFEMSVEPTGYIVDTLYAVSKEAFAKMKLMTRERISIKFLKSEGQPPLTLHTRVICDLMSEKSFDKKLYMEWVVSVETESGVKYSVEDVHTTDNILDQIFLGKNKYAFVDESSSADRCVWTLRKVASGGNDSPSGDNQPLLSRKRRRRQQSISRRNRRNTSRGQHFRRKTGRDISGRNPGHWKHAAR